MQLVPSLDDKGASSDVCACVQLPESVKVCPVPLANWDRWKVAPAQPRLHWILGTHSTNHTHTTHTHSGLFRVLVWFGAYHYTPLGAARLTEVDWHCQELSQPNVWIYIRTLSRFAKAFVFLLGNPFHAQMIDDGKKESLGPVDRLRTAACNENKSDQIETERFLSTLECSCLRTSILEGRQWLKINGGNQHFCYCLALTCWSSWLFSISPQYQVNSLLIFEN